MLAACSMLSLHVPFGARLFKERKFDLRGRIGFWTLAAAPDRLPSIYSSMPTRTL